MTTIILLFSLFSLVFAISITQYVEAQTQGIGTVSSSDSSTTEYPIFATAGVNMYSNGDIYDIRELGDDNVITANLINLTNTKITKITLAENSGFIGECFFPSCSPNVNATNATMTAKIWSNATIGSSRFSDLIEEASTETINIQDYIIPFTPFPPPFDSRHPNFPITFNFTTPITLTGEYLVGFEFHDIQQNLTVVFITSSNGGPSPEQDIESVYGVCIGDPTSPTFNFTDVLSDCPDNIQNGGTFDFNPVKDWFFEIIAEKTVNDLSVNTSIAPTKLRGYWTFDDITVDDQIALNAGTVGHEGDATMIDYRLGSNKTLTRNSTGLIGASYIHDGTNNLFNGTVTDTANYLQVGTFTNDNQKNWNFLHQMGSTANKTATSLWIRVNSTSTLPTNTVGFIASQIVGTTGNGMMYGMGTGNTEIQIQTWQNDTEYVNFSFDPLEGADPFVFPSFIDPPHFDGQWHNIIINFDKTNSTFPVKVCIDGTEAVGGECRSIPINDPANFDLTDPTYTLILAPIFEEVDNSFEGFEMDEIAIWEDYLLTDSEIDQVASMSVGSSPDTDSDGIFNEVDILPNTFSDDFSDQSLGGTSSGTITTRGDQILTISEEANPDGMRITADVSGGLLPAVINTCGEISIITLSPGDDIVVTCGSVSIIAITGPVEISFNLDNTEANVTLPEDNEITFDPDFFSFTAPLTNTQSLVILVNGTEITLNPGSTISLGLLKITKLTTGGDDTFDFTITGPTSYNTSINTDGGETRSSTTTLMQHIDTSVEEDLFADLGSDVKIAQAFSLNGQKISQVIFRGIDSVSTTGTLTAYVWGDISNGTNDGDEVIIQQSDILDLSVTTMDQFQAFNFTNPVSFTGTAYIGLVWENLNDESVITGTDQDISGGNSLYLIDGCFVIDSGVWNQGCDAFLSNGLEFIALHLEHDTTVDDFEIISGINPGSLVIYQTFDNAQISSDNIAINAGTFGSLGDLSSLIDDTTDSVMGDKYKTSIVLNSSSILGQALIKDNDDTAFHIGTYWEKNPAWNYLYDSTPDEWSISFWLKGDLDDPNIVPILNTDDGGNSGISFGFQDNKPFLRLNSASTGDLINATFNTASGFPNDGNFHLITINVEKSNATSTVQICIDTDCATEDRLGTFDPISFDHTQGVQMIIGENENEFFTYENTVKQFQIDDLCIWKGSVLSSSQRNTLYNSGNGLTCATISGVGGGMGMDGPSPIDPGTYSIEETVPAGWSLTNATCNDGSSSFSVDSISGIVIDSGDAIECTFENEFTVSTDTDEDGIFDEIDVLPNTVSDDFSDVSLGGTTSGTITTRGNQTLTISEETNPGGVRIAADVSGGLLPAVVEACGGISIIALSPGDNIVVTCGSVTIDVINGPVEVTFIGSGGIQATSTLPQGNSITFDQDTFSFSVPFTNADPVVIIVEGEQIILSPGQAVSVLSSNKDSFIKQGELNTNEGANAMMRVRDNGNNRALVSFDQDEVLAAIQERTLSSATLRLYIEENGNNWGPNGRTIDIHRLLDDWAQGNGFNDKPQSMPLLQFNELKTRGDGLGVTWKCATDTEINNQQTDCNPEWDGATFSLTPTDTVTIFKDNPPTGTIKTVGWIEFDVTADLEAFLSTEQNYGWIVKKTEEGAPGLVEFTSGEAAANIPELVLVFD